MVLLHGKLKREMDGGIDRKDFSSFSFHLFLFFFFSHAFCSFTDNFCTCAWEFHKIVKEKKKRLIG
jgi:hypothetical protein